MKRLTFYAQLLLYVVLFQVANAQNEDLINKIRQIGIDSIRPFEINNSRYKAAYELFVSQDIEHAKPESGKFYQRVILRHRGFDRPTVIVTEGYAAGYALWADYDDEIAEALDANLIVVEHRYFGKSVPKPKVWEHLNLANATADLHFVNQMFRKIYPMSWVSTGISKGGQTSIYYRYFYPDDVQASVPYVAPLNFSVSDKRVYTFQDTVANAHCRQRLLELQTDLLKRREVFEPMFADSAAKRELTFGLVGGVAKAFEYNVLEFGFAYWQWYPISCEALPEPGSDKNLVFGAFAEATGYDFFADQSIRAFQPFFYQALTEMGFYSYNVKPFKEYLNEVKQPSFNHTLPDGIKANYNKKLSKKVSRWLQKDGNNMLYIYGGYDAWSSTAVQTGDKTNAIKLVLPGGSHATRLGNFDEATRLEAISRLKEWTGVQ